MTTVLYRGRRVEVDDCTAERWQYLTDYTPNPVNRWGFPLRPMPAGIYNGDNVAAGIYVDWQDDHVREFCFTQRRTAVVDQPTHRQLATIYGPFQHPLHPYRAADCWARRVDRTQARGGQARDPQARDYRRYSNRRWSTTGLITATAQAAASGTRCFGVELEFNRSTGDSYLSGVHHHYVTERAHDIAAAAQYAGLTFVERWGHYGRNMSTAGWQGTYDSTTTGGEIISDILAGDESSLAEIRQMLAIIRDNGGVAGERQGVHVHHDCRDFNDGDKVRLVDNLQALAPILEGYLPRSRRAGYWCGRMSASDWAAERRNVAAGRGGSGSHNYAFNLGHLFGPSPRVEFRSFGQSLNSAKLRCWIRVGQAIVAATKAGVAFGHGLDPTQMVGILRQHGLSQAAADRFVDTWDRRATGRPVLAA